MLLLVVEPTSSAKRIVSDRKMGESSRIRRKISIPAQGIRVNRNPGGNENQSLFRRTEGWNTLNNTTRSNQEERVFSFARLHARAD
jgi:hypothetical protein